jgi:hypothetical protein
MKSKPAIIIHYCVALAAVFFGVAFICYDREWAEIPFAALLLVIVVGSLETMRERREKDT